MILLAVAAWATPTHPLGALHALPRSATALRDNGMDASEVTALLDVLHASDLPPADVVALLSRSSDLVREHGPIAHCASFVRDQLDAGVRGPALDEALEAAHQGKAAEVPAPVEPEPTATPKPRPVRPRPKPAGNPKGVGSKRKPVTKKGVGSKR